MPRRRIEGWGEEVSILEEYGRGRSFGGGGAFTSRASASWEKRLKRR